MRRNSLTIRGMILNNFYLNLLRLGWVIINHSYLDTVVSQLTVVSPSPLRILIVQTALGSSFIGNIRVTVNCILYTHN